MKKIFTLSAAAILSVGSLSAIEEVKPNIVTSADNQVQTFNDNLVIYTCAKPELKKGAADQDTIAGFISAESFSSALCGTESELGTRFTSALVNSTNLVALKTSYTDPETGASFPAGYYTPYNASGKEFKLQLDGGSVVSSNATGIKNVKKIILYVAGTSTSCQPTSCYTKDGVANTVYDAGHEKSITLSDSRYTVSLNGKIKALTPSVDDDATVIVDDVEKPLMMVNKDNSYYPVKLDKGAPATDWTSFATERPVRIVIDFTKPYELITKEDANRTDGNGNTMIFKNWADHDSNYPKGYEIYHERGGYMFNPTAYFNVKSGDWDVAQETAGDAIEWSADLIIKQNIKKAGYLLGMAIISGSEDAKTYYASVAESTDEEEATWKETAFAAPSQDFLATDNAKKNIFFSYKMQPELRTMIEDYYGENSSEIGYAIQEKETLNLVAGKTYTLNIAAVCDPLKVVTINGNGATIKVGANGQFIAQKGIVIDNVVIDATKATKALVAMATENIEASLSTFVDGASKYTAGTQNMNEAERVVIKNSTIKNLPQALISGSFGNWAIDTLSVENSIVNFNTEAIYENNNMGKAAIDMAAFQSISLSNSTFYNTAANIGTYFFRMKNASNAQPQKVWGTDATATITFTNNTFCNAMGSKDFANNFVSKNNVTINLKNNVFVNCYRIKSKFKGGCNLNADSKETNLIDSIGYSLDSGEADIMTVATTGVVLPTVETGFEMAAMGACFGLNAEYVAMGDPRWAAYVKEAAAIESIEATSAKSNIMFNLSGQRVNNAKGLVIKNGKKMIIR